MMQQILSTQDALKPSSPLLVQGLLCNGVRYPFVAVRWGKAWPGLGLEGFESESGFAKLTTMDSSHVLLKPPWHAVTHRTVNRSTGNFNPGACVNCSRSGNCHCPELWARRALRGLLTRIRSTLSRRVESKSTGAPNLLCISITAAQDGGARHIIATSPACDGGTHHAPSRDRNTNSKAPQHSRNCIRTVRSEWTSPLFAGDAQSLDCPWMPPLAPGGDRSIGGISGKAARSRHAPHSGPAAIHGKPWCG